MLYRARVAGPRRKAQEALLQEPAALQEVSRRLQAPGRRRTGETRPRRPLRARPGAHEEALQGAARIDRVLSWPGRLLQISATNPRRRTLMYAETFLADA